MKIELSEPCETRPIRFLEVVRFGDWRIKIYSIAYQEERARPELVGAAKDLAERNFSALPPFEGGRYGVGYMGVHDGRGYNIVFLDWWADENELHHKVFISSKESPGEFRDATLSGPTAGVWDLRVMGFERDAWVENVLRNPDGPDIGAYLMAYFNEDA